MTAIIAISICLFIGFISDFACRKNRFMAFLGPVLLAYFLGILFGNIVPGTTKLEPFFQHILEVSILFAIPMMLYSADFLTWLKGAKSTVISFLLAVISVVITVTMGAIIFHKHVPAAWNVSGLLTGVYVGGTVNMNAVALALGVDQTSFMFVNASDMFFSTFYFLFWTSTAKTVFAKFLKPFPIETISAKASRRASKMLDPTKTLPKRQHVARVTMFTLALVGIGVGSLQLLGLLGPATAISTVSALGIAASFSLKVRAMPGSYQSGQFLLLVFCAAMGALTHIHDFFSAGAPLSLFVAFALSSSVLIHFFLARLFKIDRDTFMITSCATIMSPPFVGGVVRSLGNPAVLVAGITTGLVGYATATYAGIAVASFLNYFFH